MLRWALLLGLLSAAPALAADVGNRRPMVTQGVPTWVAHAPTAGAADLDLDFVNGRYWQRNFPVGTLNVYSEVRASVGYSVNTTGLWTLFPVNVPRITDKGLLSEETRTNVVLWNRDLTNAAWTKSNITAALDQTGIDNGASSASSLTATAGNGTALQAITLASSARFQSAFVKRITGTGVVNMTTDNGSTWTAVTPCSSATFIGASTCRVVIPTQTLANPTVGFRIVTSGDAIAVDMAQSEASNSFATSPIATTTVAVARAGDRFSIIGGGANRPVFGSTYSVVLRAVYNAPDNYATTQIPLLLNTDTNNRVQFNRLTTTNVIRIQTVSGGTTTSASGALMSQGGTNTLGFSMAAGAQVASLNGAAVFTSASALPVGTSVVAFIGSNNGGTSNCDCYIGRLAIWLHAALPNAILQSPSLP